MEQKKFAKMLKIITVCATCVLVVMVGIILGQYIKLGSLNKQSNNLDAELASLNSQRQNLEQGIANRLTDAYIEEQAREQLGMIKEGETLYIYK